MLNYLLDTNAAIAWLADETDFGSLLESAESVYLSSITLGELYFGAENSQRVRENLQHVERIAQRFPILDCTHNTAREFGRVRAQLKRIGRPISPNDNWIAAIAIEHDLTLLTRDTDFNAVDGLNVHSW